MHDPQTRVPFDEWLRHLDARGILSSQKLFDNRITMYDAMPAVWKHLSVEKRQAVMQTIGRFYRDSSFNEKIWTRRRVAYLARYFKLDDVYKLRACYFIAMKDPSVIVHTEEEVTHIVEPNVTSRIDVSCC